VKKPSRNLISINYFENSNKNLTENFLSEKLGVSRNTIIIPHEKIAFESGQE